MLEEREKEKILNFLKHIEATPNEVPIRLLDMVSPEQLSVLLEICYMFGRRDLALRILKLLLGSRRLPPADSQGMTE